MNGAEALIETLFKGGVRVCFANPGTSEMQLVAAIDKQDGMEAILGLFEGVVTGAADGYARMTDAPAATLLQKKGKLPFLWQPIVDGWPAAMAAKRRRCLWPSAFSTFK